MERIINWFCKNHVAANLLMLLVIVMGVMTWPTLKKEIFPETALDVISIQVSYPNAAPEEVESGVCIPVEDAINEVEGIERISSTSVENVGVVLAELKVGYNSREVMEDIKTKVDSVTNFPNDAEKPIVSEASIKYQVLSIAVMADADEKSLKKIAERVRDDVSLLPGITQVSLAGVRQYEVSIEVAEDTLREYGLTFDQVANAIRRSSIDLPSGTIKTDKGDILLRAKGKRYYGKDFRDIEVVARPDGSSLTLGKIATIRDGFEDTQVSSKLNGKPCILVNVYRIGDEDTLETAGTVRNYIAEKDKRFPADVEMQIWNDGSKYLKGRLDLLRKNGIYGLILVYIVLALFLRPGLAALVALGIPASFAGAVITMKYTGVSINMISIFGFILVLGIVVDDAIVVGENVFKRMRHGEDPKIAAPKGTHEVGVVVIFGVLTTMVSFTPMLGLSGVTGKIFPNIPLIVIPVLAFSLLQSKLVLPAHLSYLKPIKRDREVTAFTKFRRLFSDSLVKFVDKFYKPLLKICLEFRYVVFTAFFGLFVICIAFAGFGWVNFSFFPSVESEIVSAKLTMSNSVSYEETKRAIDKIESAALEVQKRHKDKHGNPVIKNIFASAGTQPFITGFSFVDISNRENKGEVTLELVPAKDRDISFKQIVSEMREIIGNIPNNEELFFVGETQPGGRAIHLQVSGKNLELLQKIALQIQNEIENFKGAKDVSNSHRRGKREIKIKMKPQGKALGLHLGDVTRQVRQAFYGEEVHRLQRDKSEVKVMVRYPLKDRRSIFNLSDMKIRTGQGGEVPLREIADIDFGWSYASIERSDRRRSINVYADIDTEVEGANADKISSSLEKDVLPELQKRYPSIKYSFEGEQKDQRDAMKELFVKFFIALLIMYVMMSIPLASYVQPIIIMSVIPFGIIGAIFGHLLLGLDLSIMSMCGIAALAGVVVNDSLVLVDYINRHAAQDMSPLEAAWNAGAARFRAVILTSMTTFAGLTPMLFETDLQAKFLIPMAVSLGFGVMFATVITLILVPVIYLMLNDIKNLLFGKKVIMSGRYTNANE